MNEKLYEQEYGHIPNTLKERLQFLLTFKSKVREKKIIEEIINCIKQYNKIKYKEFNFIWYTVPKPCARPRINTRGFYGRIFVPRARENKDRFKRFFNEKYPNFKVIDVPQIYIGVDAYLPTPKSFNQIKTVLAELGIIRPRREDMDNIYKAAADQIQDTVIANDNLIDKIVGERYYSIKPRYEYHIKYPINLPEYLL